MNVRPAAVSRLQTVPAASPSLGMQSDPKRRGGSLIGLARHSRDRRYGESPVSNRIRAGLTRTSNCQRAPAAAVALPVSPAPPSAAS